MSFGPIVFGLKAWSHFDLQNKQGDQIGKCLAFGLLLEAHCDFLKEEVAQRKVNIFGNLSVKHFFYIFAQIRSFEHGLL
jgi:hypothetical protein